MAFILKILLFVVVSTFASVYAQVDSMAPRHNYPPPLFQYHNQRPPALVDVRPKFPGYVSQGGSQKSLYGYSPKPPEITTPHPQPTKKIRRLSPLPKNPYPPPTTKPPKPTYPLPHGQVHLPPHSNFGPPPAQHQLHFNQPHPDFQHQPQPHGHFYQPQRPIHPPQPPPDPHGRPFSHSFHRPQKFDRNSPYLQQQPSPPQFSQGSQRGHFPPPQNFHHFVSQNQGPPPAVSGGGPLPGGHGSPRLPYPPLPQKPVVYNSSPRPRVPEVPYVKSPPKKDASSRIGKGLQARQGLPYHPEFGYPYYSDGTSYYFRIPSTKLTRYLPPSPVSIA